MQELRIPRGMWTWRGSTMVLLLLLVPTLTVLMLVPNAQTLPAASAIRSVVVAVAMLAAAIALYLHHRVTRSDQSGWLSVALSTGAVPGLALGAWSFAHPGEVEGHAAWILVFRILNTMLMLALVAGSQRFRLPLDPLALGLLGGLALTLARQAILAASPPLHQPPGLALTTGLLLCLLTYGLGTRIMQLISLPRWLRARCFLGLGTLTAAGALDPLARHHSAVSAVALVCGLAGATLVTSGAAAGLHVALAEEHHRVAELQAEIARIELDTREDRARLHEIDSTVAGIASASRLIHNTPDLTDSRRDVLTGMMAAEVERLHRLVAARSVDQPRSIDLDDVVGQIVVSHRARGHGVQWTPTGGLRVLGRSDDLAEILDVLLHNAARHGSADLIVVTAVADADGVELAVTDRGPGIEASVRGRVFDYGVRGPDSAGEGIGLHLARDLARGLGGELSSEELPSGARFVLHLPSPPPREEVPAGGAVVHAAT